MTQTTHLIKNAGQISIGTSIKCVTNGNMALKARYFKMEVIFSLVGP